MKYFWIIYLFELNSFKNYSDYNQFSLRNYIKNTKIHNTGKLKTQIANINIVYMLTSNILPVVSRMWTQVSGNLGKTFKKNYL